MKEKKLDIKRLFENYIFKKRQVFYTSKEQLNSLDFMKLPPEIKISFFDFNHQTKKDLEELMNDIMPIKKAEKYIDRYDKKEEWLLFISYIKNEPAGCLWLLNIKEDDMKFDSFIHNKSQILLGGVYVHKDFRGNKLHILMKEKALNYALNTFEEKIVVSIIEKSNIPSIKNNIKLKTPILGTNYLVKFIGKNIFSIFIDKDKKIKIWYLNNYKQTHK